MSFLAVLFAVAALDAPAADQAPQSEAPAATAPTDVAPATANGKASSTRVVCRTEAVTGSRFGHKVCVTEESSKLRRQEERQALERVQTMIPRK